MQVTCVECKAAPFYGQDSFLDHMKTRHFAFSDDKYQYDCVVCHKTYSKKNFRRHFTSTHGHLFETPTPDVNPDCTIISSPNKDHPLCSDLDEYDNDLNTSWADVESTESASPSNQSSSPNSTSHSPLPSVSVNAAVQQVFDTCDSYWHELLARPDMTTKLSTQIHIKLMKILELASELYKPYVDSSVWESITTDINIEASKRSSQYLLMQNLQNNPNFVPPDACAISYRREIRTKQGVGQTTEIKSNNLGSIPIRDTLRNLFKSTGITDQLLFTSTCADPYHPLSANRSKQIFEKLGDRDSIQLQLYVDDYGTANPLGYAAATSKLMGCYFRILNLPSKLQTSDTIFLSFLVLKNDVDNLQSVIRSVLLPQLLELEDKGINITVKGVSTTFPVILHSVVGDNAGVHELINLMMSWTGNSPCRFCKLTYTEVKKACKVTPSKLKTKAWYDDLFRNNLSDLAKHGINGKCVLNELKFFNTMDTLCVDVMHDVLEGHLRCLLATTAQHLSKDGFSVKALNSAIAMFPFAGTMLDSKPGPVYLQDVKDGELKHSTATKTLNLAQMLPLILREAEYEIDISKPIWQTYLLFLEILDILLAHRITDGMLTSLESKTEKYLQLFISIGGKMTVKPHYLIHYPDVIRRHGPVIHHWCMRFEAKHKGFKQYARVNFNRQDLAMTLAKKHSLCAMQLGSVAFCNPARVAFLACNPESCRERNYTARVAQCNPLRCKMQLNFSQCGALRQKLTNIATDLLCLTILKDIKNVFTSPEITPALKDDDLFVFSGSDFTHSLILRGLDDADLSACIFGHIISPLTCIQIRNCSFSSEAFKSVAINLVAPKYFYVELTDAVISDTNAFNFISQHFGFVKIIRINPLRSYNWVNNMLECELFNFDTLLISGKPTKLVSFTFESITTLFEKLPTPCEIALIVDEKDYNLAKELLMNVFAGIPTIQVNDLKALYLTAAGEEQITLVYDNGQWVFVNRPTTEFVD